MPAEDHLKATIARRPSPTKTWCVVIEGELETGSHPHRESWMGVTPGASVSIMERAPNAEIDV
jgi:hypothetical protein